MTPTLSDRDRARLAAVTRHHRPETGAAFDPDNKPMTRAERARWARSVDWYGEDDAAVIRAALDAGRPSRPQSAQADRAVTDRAPGGPRHRPIR